jgi:hypothetical protein
MKRILILVILAIVFTINANGQNLVFLGEHSFPCTETYTLQSNSDFARIDDLKIVFAKDGNKGLLVVSSKIVPNVRILGKLIIYLNDGNVITCIDKGMNDNVDGIATSAYYLTNEEIAKMKKSNIHTIRYELKSTSLNVGTLFDGNYSASNKGSSATDFTTVMSAFF